MKAPTLGPDVVRFMGWVNQFRTLSVLADADTADQVTQVRPLHSEQPSRHGSLQLQRSVLTGRHPRRRVPTAQMASVWCARRACS